MARSIPKVREGALQQQSAEGTPPDTIPIGTAAWYSWLEQHHAFTFETPRTTFTAHKEQRPGGWYWYAYRRSRGKLHTAYLGKSAELSLPRLNTTAEALERAGEALEDGTHRPLRVSGETALQGQQASIIAFPTTSTGAEGLREPEPVPKHPLPVQLTPLIGREQDAASAAALLRRPEVRLLTMIGTAGIGKTRLALQVATDVLYDFLDGVFFVALAPIRDPDLVLPTMAQALGLKEKGGEPLAERLKAYLHRKHYLLVLDNFEQVITAAPLLVELLAASPKLKLLVTSREALHLRAERQFAVPPLALPDLKRLPEVDALAEYAAVALFLEGAQAIRPDFQLTAANAHAIAEICVRLDGLPLAIELAAARIKHFSPQALLARLDRRLQVLVGGARDLPERQQTLRATIEWSYDLLNAAEQRLLRQLSVFTGGCTLSAIEAVSVTLGDEAEQVLEGVASLIDKSLLHQSKQEDEEPRLVMLETIREYGLEALVTRGEVEATRQAHAAYYLALTEAAEPELVGPQQAVWLERLEEEHDNLRATMRWSLEPAGGDEGGQHKETALRLSAALRRFWLVHGHISEGRSFLEQALTASLGIVASVRAKVLQAAASLATYADDYAQAERLCEESLALFRELGDRAGIAFSLLLLGQAASTRGSPAAACMHTEEALALFREVGEQDGIAWSLSNLAEIVGNQGEYARAQALFKESLAMHRALGNKRGIAWVLCHLAWVLFVSQSNPAPAHALLVEGLALYRELGDKGDMAQCLSLSGRLALCQGDTTTGRSLLEESMMLSREIGSQWGIADSLAGLAQVQASQGDLAAARTLYEKSLTIASEWNYKDLFPACLEGLAAVVVLQGEPAWAARLWGTAEALREAMGTPIPPVYRADYDRSVAAARANLDEQAFAAAWSEGRTMSLEQALAAKGTVRIPATIPVKPPSAPQAHMPSISPAGLTTREMDVLRLLVQGLTSAQIADQLVIGLVTVNAHVRSIYSKLGVTSRAAATRYAIEHQLL